MEVPAQSNRKNEKSFQNSGLINVRKKHRAIENNNTLFIDEE